MLICNVCRLKYGCLGKLRLSSLLQQLDVPARITPQAEE